MRSQASNDSETYPASQRECAQKLLFRILQCPRSQQEGHDGEWRRQYGGHRHSPKTPALKTLINLLRLFLWPPPFESLVAAFSSQSLCFISPHQGSARRHTRVTP